MSKPNKHIYILVICGGGGTRLWPRSRQKSPKQFIKLLGEKTLLQETVERAQKIVSFQKIFFVTGREYAGAILKDNPQIPPGNIIIEPQKKHTAIAMILGATKINQIDPEAVIINLWSDQLVKNNRNFATDLKKAAQTAHQQKSLVALGIEPTFPHTGLGYIKVGKEIDPQVFKVERFTEKPNLKTAQKFIKNGHYYWNLGTYTWPVKIFFQELKKLNPSLYHLGEKIKKGLGGINEWREINAVYQKVLPVSIDEAVAEKTQNMLLLPATFDWYDVGDWQTVWDKSPKDKNGNVILNAKRKEQAVVIDAKNNLIHLDQKLIAVAYINNLVIVDTPDALLVCAKDKSQKIKDLVSKIKEKNPRYV